MNRPAALSLITFVGLILSGQRADAQKAVNQAPSLIFGLTSTLTIGMSESAVRQALTDYTISPPAQGTPFRSVVTKTGPPFRSLGNVLFSDGQLVSASVIWPHEGRKDLDLADAIYGAFASLERADARGCAISTTHYPEQPGFDVKDMDIRCRAAGRSVTILISHTQSTEGVTIQETIFQPR